MQKETFHVNAKEQYRLDVYIQEESPEITLSHLRPFVLVCPGGGYVGTSDREADPIAFAYLAAGFHAGVLRYSVGPDASYPNPNTDLSVALRIIRENAERWHADPNKVAVCGFSAGGHLAAMQGVHWNDPELMRLSGCANGENRPDALILAYPVITYGKYAHTDSIANLLNRFREAGTPEELARMLDFVSCEKYVGPHTPPTFLFHTRLDSGVSVCNSLLFAQALAENGIDFEMHIFEQGDHGLAMSNRTTARTGAALVNEDAEAWMKLSCNWLWNHFE